MQIFVRMMYIDAYKNNNVKFVMICRIWVCPTTAHTMPKFSYTDLKIFHHQDVLVSLR